MYFCSSTENSGPVKQLTALYTSHFGTEPLRTEALPASGSNRRYVRFFGPEGTVIGAIGTDRDENRAFITLSRHFRAQGLPVPEVIACSDDELRYLQEDLGGIALFDVLKSGRESGDYTPEQRDLLLKTIRLLPRIQFEGAKGLDWSVCFPQREFDGRMIDFDLNYFKYDFLKLTRTEFNEIRLQDDFDRLKADLLRVPSETFLYRDFQARNVMIRGGEPWLIDYQGGRKGPFYYDLASFVFQARARYPEDLRNELIAAYREALAPYAAIPEAEFHSRLRLFVLFRTLQVLGAYGYRGLFERKAHFLESIPFALQGVRELLPLPEYPYLSEILKRLSETPSAEAETPAGLTVRVYSFSFRKGIPEDASGNGGGYVFDCRGTHNPGKYDQYKQLTGRDEPVIRFLEEDGEILPFLEHAKALVVPHVRRYLERGFTSLQVSFGCTGGQHRSVFCAERMAHFLHDQFPAARIVLIHRERGIQETYEPTL